MKRKLLFLATLALGLAALPLHADLLELKNGEMLDGKYTGGTAGTLRFETSAGMQVVETSRIIALTFITHTPAATPAPAPTPAAPGKTVTLRSGTLLLVRMMDSVSSRNAPGANFTTRLEYNLAADGVVAVPAGTVIYGKVQGSTQARRTIGRSTLDIRLAQMSLKGNPVPIVTSGYRVAGQASIAKAAKGAAAGATIGAIAGNAGKGAAIGATTGALMRGQTITIPPGTLLEFTLTHPLSLQTSN